MDTGGGSVRVLHVDDERDFASMAADFLMRENDRFDVVTETSTTDGLERLQQEEFTISASYDDAGTLRGFGNLIKEATDPIPAQ